MTVVSFTIIDKSGRKALLVISALLMANCYAGLGGFFLIKTHYLELASKLNWLPLVCIAVYISAFSIGYGPVPWIMMGEIYSSEVRNAQEFLKIGFTILYSIIVYYNNYDRVIRQQPRVGLSAFVPLQDVCLIRRALLWYDRIFYIDILYMYIHIKSETIILISCIWNATYYFILFDSINVYIVY